METKVYPGDKEDSDSFGKLFKLIGGIFLSFAVIRFLDNLGIEYFKSPYLLFGFGYLVFMAGFSIQKRKFPIILKKRKLLQSWVTLEGVISFLQ